jgi:hypothetical protein
MTEEQRATILGVPLVQAIDAYFTARQRFIVALLQMDQDAMRAAEADSKLALSNWLALVVERVDSRSAALLVDALKRIENLEALLGVDRGRG